MVCWSSVLDSGDSRFVLAFILVETLALGLCRCPSRNPHLDPLVEAFAVLSHSLSLGAILREVAHCSASVTVVPDCVDVPLVHLPLPRPVEVALQRTLTVIHFPDVHGRPLPQAQKTLLMEEVKQRPVAQKSPQQYWKIACSPCRRSVSCHGVGRR